MAEAVATTASAATGQAAEVAKPAVRKAEPLVRMAAKTVLGALVASVARAEAEGMACVG